MKIALINNHLSRQRFNRYLLSTGNNTAQSKRLYAANIRLAQAFHPILSQFGVVLRNNLNRQLSAHFGDSDWIINQKSGFMSDGSLATSRFFLRACVQKTENNLRRVGIPITAGKIISDQMFGFWLAFFIPHHYMLVGGQPIYVFAHKPAAETRATIHHKLEAIKTFRNRMNHCEPLCFQGNTIDCTGALTIRDTLYNLLDWIDPQLRGYFDTIDSIPVKVARIMQI